MRDFPFKADILAYQTNDKNTCYEVNFTVDNSETIFVASFHTEFEAQALRNALNKLSDSDAFDFVKLFNGPFLLTAGS